GRGRRRRGRGRRRSPARAIDQFPRRLRGEDERGRPLDEVFTGWPARIVQHETDHLDGTLYLDRAEPRSLSTNEAVASLWPHPTPHPAAEALGFRLP
ncbi:peptide deformylase, partial [Streptomyces eurythermus]